MSVEAPEALILARQMDKELRGKRVKSYSLQDYEKLQRIGFLNKDIRAFEQLVNGKVESVTSRGNVIRVKFDNGANLLLSPEYGGRVTYHTDMTTVPSKLHLRVDFNDSTVLAVRLTGMGIIQTFKDSELDRSYVYKRDFLSEKPSPANDSEFTFDRFLQLLANRKDMMKLLLVGRDAVVVGLGNSAYQDIIFRARIHPKRKASELSEKEKRALYDAIRSVVQERNKLGGKDKFVDLYGKSGRYVPAMGSHLKMCPTCGTAIEKLSIGGGQTYFCPKCQR
jgi:formamidopyrimidine-DNA glycosylase